MKNFGSITVHYAILIVFNCYLLFSDAISSSCSQSPAESASKLFQSNNIMLSHYMLSRKNY